MDEFYSLLIRPYNEQISNDFIQQSDRVLPYKDEDYPAYWDVLIEHLSSFEKSSSVFEIGSGLGDVLVLLYHLGFNKIRGIERDAYVAEMANHKLLRLCGKSDLVEVGNYPVKIASPDILLQINCVYPNGMFHKQEYLDQLLRFYENAAPRHYFLEVIDSSYTKPSAVFPNFVRLSEDDISKTFTGLKIQSFQTYRYPKNTSSKRLYIVSQ